MCHYTKINVRISGNTTSSVSELSDSMQITYPRSAATTYTTAIPVDIVNVKTTMPIRENAYTTNVVSLKQKHKKIKSI